MSFKSIIIRLYFMLIHCDGKVNEGEIALGKRIMEAEHISEAEFDRLMAGLQASDIPSLYRQSLADLKKLPVQLQVRCIAWLCVLANADGFMDRAEWQFIYKIYHRELQLPLDVIMGVQKELTRKINTVIVEQMAPKVSAPRLALF